MFVYNSVIFIWGGFQNNTLKDLLLLYIFWLKLKTPQYCNFIWIINTIVTYNGWSIYPCIFVVSWLPFNVMQQNISPISPARPNWIVLIQSLTLLLYMNLKCNGFVNEGRDVTPLLKGKEVLHPPPKKKRYS